MAQLPQWCKRMEPEDPRLLEKIVENLELSAERINRLEHEVRTLRSQLSQLGTR